MDEKELLKKDLVLTYRMNRFDGNPAQIDLEGLWLPSDVRKMEKSLLRAARAHKQELLRTMKGKKNGKTGKKK